MIDVIFDGNSLYARCYYASMKDEKIQELEGAFDRPKNPCLLGVKMVLNILDPYSERVGKKVDRMLFCWDGKAKSEKRRLVEKPEGYDPIRLEFMHVMTELFGASHCQAIDHEADDAVATAVYRTSETDEVYVVSGDKDLQQLQSSNVHFYCLNESSVLSRQTILDKWHVKRPSQICIALAILGDPGDNIPGIHGWGRKKVEKLFEAVSPRMNLEEALEAIEAQIPAPKQVEFYHSLEMTVLDPNVPEVPDPAPIQFASPDRVREMRYNELVGRFSQIKHFYEGGNLEAVESMIDEV